MLLPTFEVGVKDFQIGAIRGRNPDNPKSRVAGLPTEQMLELSEGGTANCLTSVQKDNVVVETSLIDTKNIMQYNGATEILKDYNEKTSFNEADSYQILRILWKEARESSLSEWATRGFNSFQQENLLQSCLHEKSVCKSWRKQSRLLIGSCISEKDKKILSERQILSKMWKEWEARYSSYRRKLPKQHSKQLNVIMSKLSYKNSQTEANLQDEELQKSGKRLWILRKTLSEIQKTWKSFQGETQPVLRDYRIRRLTPFECFKLQGMNDSDIVLVNSDTQSYKIAGNGIEINTMRSIVRQLYIPVKSVLSLF